MPGPISILIVEDEPLIRMDIADQLLDRGFDVLEACDADDAIAVLAEHSEVQVLFTDVDMPGSMDGLMLAEAVSHRWPPVGIIVTSGRSRLSDDHLPDDGRFISKPYMADLIAATAFELTAR